MIPTFLFSIWAAIAPGMGNHLWQSTLCLGLAGLLTLTLRRNHARARYGVWLAASIKFLVPFSLLVGIGSHLARPRVVPRADTGFFVVMEQVGQPFSPPAAHVISPVAHATTLPNLLALLPAFLLALWLCGFVVVLVTWYSHWRRISAALRKAMPLREGREVDALRRVEPVGGVRSPIRLLLSPGSLEPGIFGIVRPVLVWPRGISERLNDAQMEAIMAHEVWHVRRRDNLTAAIHMVVEAIFWFHPLVWWLGSRMVDERERACDEKVLEWGGDRKIYAESVLKTCEFCIESPLACVSGVTGADLKKRITRIMTLSLANKLSLSRKVLLAAVAIAAVAGPIVLGLLNTPRIRAQAGQLTATTLPSFEAVSINPNRSGDSRSRRVYRSGKFTVSNATPKSLIESAYHVQEFQVSGGPNWINSEKFDIDAKVADSLAQELEKLPFDQQGKQNSLMVQSLLANQFKLTVHRETKELPVYVLVIAKNGPRLHEAKPGDTYPNGIKLPDGRALGGPGIVEMGPSPIMVQGEPLATLVDVLSAQMGRTVLDQTGLKGNYDFTLQWTPDQSQAAKDKALRVGAPTTGSAPPPIFTALQEQLGLKLESTTAPMEILVIDHIERPSEN